MINKNRRHLLRAFQKIIGYRFRNKDLLEQALTHKSYVNENPLKGLKDNERLEFLGDSVLGIAISQTLFKDCPDLDEGGLTKFKSQLVSGETLSRIAKELSIGEFLLLGKGEENSGGRYHVSNLVCSLEAVIGAIYLDTGLRYAHKFISKTFAPEVKLVEEGRGERDYKSLLQQIALRKFRAMPDYKIISEEGPEHRKTFVVAVWIANKKYGMGLGSNKKKAEQLAARETLSIVEPQFLS